MILDPLLNFAAHFKEKIAKARKGIGLIKHLRQYLPTNVLDQIYKMHVRSHLDYCDFIYHIPELKRKKMRRVLIITRMKAVMKFKVQRLKLLMMVTQR